MDTIEILQELAARDGGVVSRRAALRAGADSREIERLRHRGELIVIRRGWYRLPGADRLVVAAVKSGAVLTCVSALKFRTGVWIPPGHTKTHLRRPRHLRTAKHEDCDAAKPMSSPIRAVDSLPDALRCAADCLSAEEFVAVLDSLFRLDEPYTESDLREMFADAPLRTVRLLGFVDPLAGSGTESLVRYRLACAHIRVRSQQTITNLGRVDLLVGDKLIIECDSTGYHGGDQRIADNRRDRAAVRGDYRVMRIDYTEVIGDWPAVFAEIMEIVRTRRHRGPVRPIEVVNSAESDDTMHPDAA